MHIDKYDKDCQYASNLGFMHTLTLDLLTRMCYNIFNQGVRDGKEN